MTNKLSCIRMAFTVIIALMFTVSVSGQVIIPKKDTKKDRWGYVDSADKWVVKPKYDEAGEFTKMPNGKMQAVVSSKGLKGYMDETGKVLGAGIVFEQMTPLEGNAMFVTVKGKKGVANYDGVYLVKPEAEAVEQLGNEGYIMTIKGKKGLLKNDGSWIIQPLYSDIDSSLDGFFLVAKGGKAGILDRQGTTKLAPKEYTKVEPFGNYWKVYKGPKVGLYDLSDNRLLVKPEYCDVMQPLAIASGRTLYPVSNKPGIWGAIDSNGKNVVKIKYSTIQPIVSPEALLLFEGNKAKGLYFPDKKKPCKIRGYRKNRTESNSAVVEIVYNHDWQNHNLNLLELPDGTLHDAEKGRVDNVNQFTVYKEGNHVMLYKQDGTLFMDTVANGNGPININGWTAFNTFSVGPDNNIYNAKICDNDALIVESHPGIYNMVLSDKSLTDFPVMDAKQLISGLTAVYSDNKWGVVSGTELIHPIELAEVPSSVDIDSSNKYIKLGSTLYLSNGKSMIGDSIVEVHDQYRIYNNGRLGLLDSLFSEIFPAEYDGIEYVKVYEDNSYRTRYGYKLIKNGIVSLINTDKSYIISEDQGYSDIEVVDKGRTSSRYLVCPTLYIVTKNGKKGIVNPNGGGLDPVYDSIDINYESLIDKLLFFVTKANTKSCYAFSTYNGTQVDFNGEKPVKSGTPEVEMTFKDGVIGVRITGIYLPGVDRVDVTVQVYNKNGTKAKTRSGALLRVDESRNLVKGFGSYTDFIQFSINDYNVPLFTRKDFYAQVTLKDDKGKVIPLKGKTKQPFYVQNRYY